MPRPTPEISAGSVIEKYTDLDGFTVEDGEALDISALDSQILSEVLGNNGDGEVTQEECARLKTAGFSDEFVRKIRGDKGDDPLHALKERALVLHRGVHPWHFNLFWFVFGQKPYPVRAQMIKKLGDLAQNHPAMKSSTVAASLRKIITDPDEPLYIRQTAILALPHVDVGTDFPISFQKFKTLFETRAKNDNAQLLPVVIEALGAYPQVDAGNILPFLLSCLDVGGDERVAWKIRYAALKALGHFSYHSDEATKTVIGLLQPDEKHMGSEWIKTQAAWVLGEWKEAIAVKPLLDTLSVWPENEGKVSAEALAKIGLPAIKLLTDLAESTTAELPARRLAAYSLSKIEDERETGTRLLVRLLKDDKPEMRLCAGEFLSDRGIKGWHDLIRVFEEKEESGEWQTNVVGTLRKIHKKFPEKFTAHFKTYMTDPLVPVTHKSKMLTVLSDQDITSPDLIAILAMQLDTQPDVKNQSAHQPYLFLIVNTLSSFLAHTKQVSVRNDIINILLTHLADGILREPIRISITSYGKGLQKPDDPEQHLNLVPRLMKIYRDNLGDPSTDAHNKRSAAVDLLGELPYGFFKLEKPEQFTDALVQMLNEPCDATRSKVQALIAERKPFPFNTLAKFLEDEKNNARGKVWALDLLSRAGAGDSKTDRFSLMRAVFGQMGNPNLPHQISCGHAQEFYEYYQQLDNPTLMAARVLRNYGDYPLEFMLHAGNDKDYQPRFKTFLTTAGSPQLDAPFFYRRLRDPVLRPPLFPTDCFLAEPGERSYWAMRYLEMMGANAVLTLQDKWHDRENGCRIISVAAGLSKEERLKLVDPFRAFLDKEKNKVEAAKPVDLEPGFDDDINRKLAKRAKKSAAFHLVLLKIFLDEVLNNRDPKPTINGEIQKETEVW